MTEATTTEASPLGGTPTPAPTPAPSAQEVFYPAASGEAPAPVAEAPAEAPAAVDAKPEGEAPPKPEGEGEAPAKLSPESYKFEIPDGVTVNEETLGEFKTLAAEVGIPVDKAQSLFDLGIKQVQAAVTAAAEQQVSEYNKILDGWKAELRADPEIGGTKSSETQVFLGRALDEFGSPEARVAFDQTGAGWNPAVVRFINNMARALVEGESLPPGGPANIANGRGKGDITSLFYPNS